jgi:hypothetical protein
MSASGQNRKSSVQANVFRFAPKSGHRATESTCPLSHPQSSPTEQIIGFRDFPLPRPIGANLVNFLTHCDQIWKRDSGPWLVNCRSMRCPMTKQIHSMALAVRLLPFGMVLLIGMQTAQAKQCSAAMPSDPQGRWWSYRFIDGRKCWYEGKPMLSKSLLHWPDETSALPPSVRELPPPKKETISTLAETPNIRSDREACCRAEIEGSDSFEARWRGLETTLVKY